MALGVDHGAIEVQSEPGESELLQAVAYELTAEGGHLGHAAGVGLPEGATDGGDVRQAGEAQQPPEEGVVAVVAGIAELAIAQEQVHDEQEDDEVVAEDRRDVQVAEAGAQAVLELQAAQEGLQEDEAAVGGQGLLLEAEGGEFVDFAMDRGSAMFHRAVASVHDWWDGTSHSHRSQSGGHCLVNSVAVGRRQPWITPPVRSSTRYCERSSTGDFRGDSCATPRVLCDLRVELGVRRRAQAHPGIELHQQCRAQDLVVRPDGNAVTGARYTAPNGKTETLVADLTVDATGRGAPTLELLRSTGRPLPAETTIGVDVAYSTAIFAIPEDAPREWKGVFCFPKPPSSRGSLLMPMEGHRWIVTLAGRHGERPPGDVDGFIAFAKTLRTPTTYNAIRQAKPLGDVIRYGFQESAHRHYARLDAFPKGLLPMGDAVCRFTASIPSTARE